MAEKGEFNKDIGIWKKYDDKKTKLRMKKEPLIMFGYWQIPLPIAIVLLIFTINKINYYNIDYLHLLYVIIFLIGILFWQILAFASGYQGYKLLKHDLLYENNSFSIILKKNDEQMIQIVNTIEKMLQENKINYYRFKKSSSIYNGSKEDLLIDLPLEILDDDTINRLIIFPDHIKNDKLVKKIQEYVLNES
jgi:hypothetical protein